MKKSIVMLLIMAGLFIAPAVAQDVSTPAPEVTVEPTAVATSEPPIVVDEPPAPVAPVFEAPALPDAIQAFVAALVAIFAMAIASPITAPLVSLIKRIDLPFIQNLKGNEINLIVAVLLSAILWIGQLVGFGSQVDTGFKLVYALLPFLSGAGSNFISNAAVYSVGKRNDMPILGYSRSGE